MYNVYIVISHLMPQTNAFCVYLCFTHNAPNIKYAPPGCIFFSFSPLFPFFPRTLFPFLTLYPFPLCSPCSRPPCLLSLAHRPPLALVRSPSALFPCPLSVRSLPPLLSSARRLPFSLAPLFSLVPLIHSNQKGKTALFFFLFSPLSVRPFPFPNVLTNSLTLALSLTLSLSLCYFSHHTPTNSNQLPKTHPYRPIYQYIYNITQTKTIKFYLFSPYLSALSRPSVRPFSLLFLTLTPINSKQSPKQSKKQSRKMGTKKV